MKKITMLIVLILTIPSITAQEYCEQFPEDCQGQEYDQFDDGNPNNFNFNSFEISASIDELTLKTPNQLCEENIEVKLPECKNCRTECGHSLEVVFLLEGEYEGWYEFYPEYGSYGIDKSLKCNEVLNHNNYKPFLNKDHVEIECIVTEYQEPPPIPEIEEDPCPKNSNGEYVESIDCVCQDSDEGINPEIKGITKGPTGNKKVKTIDHTDYCMVYDQEKKAYVKNVGRNHFGDLSRPLYEDDYIKPRALKKLYKTGNIEELNKLKFEEGTHVVEGECKKDKAKILKPYECPAGCIDGKCVKCEKLKGDGEKKIVFMGSGLGKEYKTKVNDMITRFSETEPFSKHIKLFSFHYIPAQIPSEIISYFMKDFEKNSNLRKITNKYGRACGKPYSTIFLTKNRWEGKGGKGAGGIGFPKTREIFVNPIPSEVMHEMGHAICGLGHDFGLGGVGGIIFEKVKKFPNCQPLPLGFQYPQENEAPTCNQWEKDTQKPNCFMGCSNSLNYARSSYGSVMAYDIRKSYNIYDDIFDWNYNHRSSKFNVVGCISCLDKLDIPDSSKKCNAMSSVLGSKSFKCTSNDDCLDIYGDCASSCNMLKGVCAFKSQNEACMFSPGKTGKCIANGVCTYNPTVECTREWKEDLRYRDTCSEKKGWEKRCIHDCQNFKCVPKEKYGFCHTNDDLGLKGCGDKENLGKCIYELDNNCISVNPIRPYPEGSECEKLTKEGLKKGKCNKDGKCIIKK